MSDLECSTEQIYHVYKKGDTKVEGPQSHPYMNCCILQSWIFNNENNSKSFCAEIQNYDQR